MPRKGTSFLIAHKPNSHLHFVVSDPNINNNKVMIVNLASFNNNGQYLT